MRKLCRFIFSRYFFSAIMILLSVAVVCLAIFVAYNYSIYIYLFMILVNIAAGLNLINKDTNPEFKLPWMMVMVTVPIFGAVIFFMFYSRRLTRKEAKLMKKIYKEYERASKLASQNSKILKDNLALLEREDVLAKGKAAAIIADDVVADVYRNTKSRYFRSGEELFESMLYDLKNAKKYIFLEYFIVEEGELWGKIYAVLRDKAREGVDVRLLYDDVGSMHTLPASFADKLENEGIKCHRFGKIIPRISTVHHNRDHRKICIADGKIAYTGGVNIADEYINKKKRFGHWKDGGIRIEGHAVLGFVKMFMTMWDFTEGSVSNYTDFFTPVDVGSEGDLGYYIPFGSGPAPTYPRHTGKNAFLNLINQSKKYVYISTPYLIIDYALTEALRCAAFRGVEVVIVTPGEADKKYVNLITKSTYPTLIEAGVKIYEYTPGFVHEKLLISDDEYAVVGTINFDYRSLVHHFEDALWMYKTPTVNIIKTEFLKTVKQSKEISSSNLKLKFKEKLAKDIMRIFAPLL